MRGIVLDGGFVQIPVSFIRDQNISAEAKVMGFLYASYANTEHLAWPGLALLMKSLGLGRDRAKRARTELVRHGLLKPIQPGGKGSPRGQFGQVKYLVSPALLIQTTAVLNASTAEIDRSTGEPQDGNTAVLNNRTPDFQSSELY